VVVTCRWLARAVVRSSSGPWCLARPPLSRHDERAFEELIEAEYLAAELLDMRRPDLFESPSGVVRGDPGHAAVGVAAQRSATDRRAGARGGVSAARTGDGQAGAGVAP
jgi:hypothetical protein